jgi:transcriptional regulator with XRE-family HTH domain
VAGTGKGPTPRQQEFGDRIRARRLKLGLSQEALALHSGINRTYIGSLEAGDRNPSLENIARLAVALGIDAADLVRGLQKLKGRD